MPTPLQSPRALALSTLLAVEKGKYGNIAVDTVLKRTDMSEADRHLYTALVYGVIERRITLEFLLSKLSSRPIAELDGTVRTALCMGLYQLIYLDRVPDHAALDETVSLVPRKVSGFVNAVLRSYLRLEASLPHLPDGGKAPREKALTTPEAWISRFPELAEGAYTAVSVCYGVPVSLCEIFAEALGYDRAVSALAGFCEKPPMTVRVNTVKTSPEALAAELTAAGMTVHPAHYASTALRVPEGAITATETFQRGDFFIQDEASQLCVAALDAHPHHVVVDTCACPGSKSFGIALTMENKGKVYAFDLHKSKLSLIESGAQRLGLSMVAASERDARKPDPDLLGKCDRVLCDVPCSGLGVIAKKPEIRHKDLTESTRLPTIQAAILEASAGYLKSGGVLVYSTCTILPAENGDVVAAFLAAHPDFEPYDFTFPAKDGSVRDIVSEGGMVTLLPDRNRTDGFFIARMRKK
ncbi:MAG: 16S rRNA (cytosine(967)-C(5))-methyltransferase RsmB [Clostridia bacterium]|nr:16S rRNA (cytosine(967)-C(5))-methyltransferase RsmB [Clostridia bacterium]